MYDARPPAESEAIATRGARAKVSARLFDAAGKPMSHVLAISTGELFRAPEVIALGYTAPKAEAIDALLRSGLVTSLFTDTAVADALLAIAERRP